MPKQYWLPVLGEVRATEFEDTLRDGGWVGGGRQPPHSWKGSFGCTLAFSTAHYTYQFQTHTLFFLTRSLLLGTGKKNLISVVKMGRIRSGGHCGKHKIWNPRMAFLQPTFLPQPAGARVSLVADGSP